jgi:regulator of protease activity HflC (stomatin/prohibitin superfamily)
LAAVPGWREHPALGRIVFALWLVFNCFVLVTEQERGVVLRFGQFARVLEPGRTSRRRGRSSG